MAKMKISTARRTLPGEEAGGGIDPVLRLHAAIGAVRQDALHSPRTRRLLASGTAKMAQKVVEEAAEVAIDAVRGDSAAVISESADLIYNLVVLWSELGIEPCQIWQEMDRREAMLGLAEKLPKPPEG